MENQIKVVDEAVITADTTLGYAPGQQTPPTLLVCKETAAITVTLPPIPTTLPSVPGTGQATIGVESGYAITIYNTATFAITVDAATGDTIDTTVSIATAKDSVTLRACEQTRTWYTVAQTPLA